MTTQPPKHPRLHSLLGDAVQDLPSGAARRLEEALCDAAENLPQPVFFTVLNDHGHGLCADGEPWTELQLSPGRALDMARVTRGLAGMASVLALLRAAHIAREDDGPANHLPAYLVDGLFQACSTLNENAERSLRP